MTTLLSMKATVLSILVLFAGCTSARSLTDQTLASENLSAQLNIGDRIWVNKKDSKGLVLVIDSIVSF